MKIKWLTGVKTLEELRKTYRKLALLHHPDKGGDTQDMQQINAEYDYLSKNLINSNQDYSEARKTYEHTVSEELKVKINEIIFLPNVTVEVIGSWIWVTGSTYLVKDQLKKAGFSFSHNKMAWYWHCGEYHKNNGKNLNMEDIRQMWGSTLIEQDDDNNSNSKQSKKLHNEKNSQQRSPAA